MQKIKSLFKQQSKSNVADASDDIAEVEIRTTTPSQSSIVLNTTNNELEVTTKESNNATDTNCVKSEVDDYCGIYLKKENVDIPIELIVLIAQFSNSRMFETFFNIGKNDIGKEKNYETDEKNKDFDHIQLLIWKSLALSYFPRIEKGLNVKNWKEFIRKILKHIKINGNNYSLNIPSFVNSQKDEEFIENCEWVYKCPLSYFSLSGDDPAIKYCNVCEKNVYLVDSIETFRGHIGKGNCVAYTSNSYLLYDIEPEMGECVPDEFLYNDLVQDLDDIQEENL